MPKKQVSPGSAGPPSKLGARRSCWRGLSPDGSALDEAARLLGLLGGEVVREITLALDYLVVLDRRLDRPPKRSGRPTR